MTIMIATSPSPSIAKVPVFHTCQFGGQKTGLALNTQSHDRSSSLRLSPGNVKAALTLRRPREKFFKGLDEQLGLLGMNPVA